MESDKRRDKTTRFCCTQILRSLSPPFITPSKECALFRWHCATMKMRFCVERNFMVGRGVEKPHLTPPHSQLTLLLSTSKHTHAHSTGTNSVCTLFKPSIRFAARRWHQRQWQNNSSFQTCNRKCFSTVKNCLWCTIHMHEKRHLKPLQTSSCFRVVLALHAQSTLIWTLVQTYKHDAFISICEKRERERKKRAPAQPVTTASNSNRHEMATMRWLFAFPKCEQHKCDERKNVAKKPLWPFGNVYYIDDHR